MLNENEEKFLTTKETAKLLKVSEGTLRIWNCQKRYPLLKSIKVGAKSVRYKLSDIMNFLNNDNEQGKIDDIFS